MTAMISTQGVLLFTSYRRPDNGNWVNEYGQYCQHMVNTVINVVTIVMQIKHPSRGQRWTVLRLLVIRVNSTIQCKTICATDSTKRWWTIARLHTVTPHNTVPSLCHWTVTQSPGLCISCPVKSRTWISITQNCPVWNQQWKEQNN